MNTLATWPHTPGPWLIGRTFSGQRPCIVGDGDSVVALLPGAWNHCSYQPHDAELIAAAPAMLALLRECHALLTDPDAEPEQADAMIARIERLTTLNDTE